MTENERNYKLKKVAYK